jgi:hypothetical protein
MDWNIRNRTLGERISIVFIVCCLLFLVWTYLGLFGLIASIIITIIVIVHLNSQKHGIKNLTKSQGQKILDNNIDWIRKRWDRIQKEKDSNAIKTVNTWYFDEATDRQLARIKKIGLYISDTKITKGQASDLIGLFEPADDKDIEILKANSIPIEGMNQTKAREVVAKILNEREKINR